MNDGVPTLRRRLLVWRMALKAHARRVRSGAFDAHSLSQDLEHMAEEAGSLAIDLLSLELDGVVADGPAEQEAREEDEFSSADTIPIGLPVPKAKA